jgi:hypothetical protein
MKPKVFNQCKKHGYDFRIMCEECQEKYSKIQEEVTKQLKENEKHNN